MNTFWSKLIKLNFAPNSWSYHRGRGPVTVWRRIKNWLRYWLLRHRPVMKLSRLLKSSNLSQTDLGKSSSKLESILNRFSKPCKAQLGSRLGLAWFNLSCSLFLKCLYIWRVWNWHCSPQHFIPAFISWIWRNFL